MTCVATGSSTGVGRVIMKRSRNDVDQEVAAIGDLTREQLAQLWEKAHGHPPPKGIRQELLVRSATWHLQVKRLGGISPNTRRLLNAAMAEVAERFSQSRPLLTQIADTSERCPAHPAETDSLSHSIGAQRHLTPMRHHASSSNAVARRPADPRLEWQDPCRRCDRGRLCLPGEGPQVADGHRAPDHRRTLVRPEVLWAMSAHAKTPLRRLHPQIERGGARPGVQLARCPARGLLPPSSPRRSVLAGSWSPITMTMAASPAARWSGRRCSGCLPDIARTKVDVVVVYKIDRLTRSLTDFAKIVEVFDGNGVSFVSVTQQFNTTTSMGRLTLNVLLSFAQFEREVTASVSATRSPPRRRRACGWAAPCRSATRSRAASC